MKGSTPVLLWYPPPTVLVYINIDYKRCLYLGTEWYILHLSWNIRNVLHQYWMQTVLMLRVVTTALIQNIRTVCTPNWINVYYISANYYHSDPKYKDVYYITASYYRSDPKYKDGLYTNIEYTFTIFRLITTTLIQNIRTFVILRLVTTALIRNIRTVCKPILNTFTIFRLITTALIRNITALCTLILNTNGVYISGQSGILHTCP